MTERYERRARDIAGRTEKLRREIRTERYARELDEIAAKGVELDRDAEVRELLAMPTEAERSAHLHRIECYYRRDPSASQPSMLTRQQAAAVAGVVNAKGIGWDAARRIVLGQA